MTKTGYDILDKVNGLLRIPSFINVITKLLEHENQSVRKKALMMLNEKATSLQKEDVPTYGNLFIGILDTLNNIIENDQFVVNKQTALLSVEMLGKAFAQYNADVFLKVIPSIVNTAKTTNSLQVCASSDI